MSATVWAYKLLSQDRHDGQDGSTVTFCDEDGEPMAIMFPSAEKARAFQAVIDAISAERNPWDVTVQLTIEEDA